MPSSFLIEVDKDLLIGYLLAGKSPPGSLDEGA